MHAKTLSVHNIMEILHNFIIVMLADLILSVGNLIAWIDELAIMLRYFTIMVLANLVVVVDDLGVMPANLVLINGRQHRREDRQVYNK
jgi:hypothetical protein